MRHRTRADIETQRLLRAARTVAVVGAGLRRTHPSRAAMDRLKQAGYEVMAVREDGGEIDGMPAWASVAEVPGRVDLVLAYGAPGREAAIVEEAAGKGAEAVWFARGQATRDARAKAEALNVPLIVDHDIEADLRMATVRSGQPTKLGVHVRRRKDEYADDRPRQSAGGWTEGGGGGSRGGGGGHAALDELKMVAGKPSPRRGQIKQRRARRTAGDRSKRSR